MSRLIPIAMIVMALALPGCGRVEPRSQDYFGAHLDEARKIVAGCRDGSVRGDECGNADYAVKIAEARERSARFFKVSPEVRQAGATTP